MSPTSPARLGATLLRVIAESAGKASAGKAEPLTSLWTNSRSPGRRSDAGDSRVLQLGLNREAGTSFRVKAPVGSYRTLKMSLHGRFAKKSLTDQDSHQRQRGAA